MKMRLLLGGLGVAFAFSMVWHLLSGAGHAQQPGGPSEPFKVPIAQPAQSTAPQAYLPTTPGFQKLPVPQQTPASLAGAPGTSAPTAFPAAAEKTNFLTKYTSQDLDQPDPNQDIAVQPNCGDWMVCIISYSGSDAPKDARRMVQELRGNSDYRLNAYVYTKGADERKAELKRIEDARESQRQQLAKIPDLPPDTRVVIPCIKSRFELQCAVLVGGYKDMESARRALEQIKKLKMPDATRVKLQTVLQYTTDQKGQYKDGNEVPINPFSQALVVPNPTLPPKRANDSNAADLAHMKRLNENEEYNLLSCPKKYTLVVTKFDLGVTFEPNKGSTPVIEKQSKSENNIDIVATKAHVVARLLRKDGLDAYVLHLDRHSLVTVGGYDAPDDPRLLRDQKRLPEYMQKTLEKTSPQLVELIKLMPRPFVMVIPH